jgi:hypothetical protein
VQMPNQTETVRLYLIEDSGDRLTFADIRDYLNQTSVLEVRDTQTKEYVRATVSLPFKSRSRTATAQEARENPDVLKDFDPATTLELNGASAVAKDSEWPRAASRDKRSTLRRAASAQFIERLERLRPIAGGAGQFDPLCARLLRYILYNEPCALSVTAEDAFGDCDFDAAFGYPCTERQKDRLKTTVAAGVPAPY